MPTASRPARPLSRRLHAVLVAAALLGAMALLSTAPATAAPGPTHWCGGTDEATKDRLPDAVSGDQIHVVYAYPSDGADRFSTIVMPIATDLSFIDTWWRSNDSTRAPRFDLFAFPGCDTAFGSLDVSVVKLRGTAGTYVGMDRTAESALESDSASAINDRTKKFLVYYDGPINPTANICGFSELGPAGAGYSFVLINSLPCGTLGGATYMAKTTTHEILHNLGAVPVGAPHPCPGDTAHICGDGQFEIMTQGGSSNSLFSYVLDYDHDDYYGHSGSWWDVQDSPFLYHLNTPTFTLWVTVSGTGQVESDLPGINCPTACAIGWDSGTQVRLSATPTGGASFVGWSGACAGTSQCSVTMDAARTVSATFAEQVTVTVAVPKTDGTGKVVSKPAGIDCPASSCSVSVNKGVKLILTAVPAKTSRFSGWTGACSGQKSTCLLLPAENVKTRPTFALLPKCAPGKKRQPACRK